MSNSNIPIDKAQVIDLSKALSAGLHEVRERGRARRKAAAQDGKPKDPALMNLLTSATDETELSTMLRRRHRFIAPVTKGEVHGLWVWDGSVWHPQAESYIARAVAEHRERCHAVAEHIVETRKNLLVPEGKTTDDILRAINAPVTRRLVKDVLAPDLRARCQTGGGMFFAVRDDIIPVANGDLLLDGNGTPLLVPPAPERHVRYRLPVGYNPAVPVPERFLQALNEWLPKEVHPTLQEVAGMLLVPATAAQTAVLFLGAGENGKSLLLTVLTALLGPENVSGHSLQHLSENRFALADLEGKLANICADLPASRVEMTDTFKALVGEDRVRVERKYEDARTTRLFCRLVFSANTVPPTEDRSHGYFRRWLVFEFSNRFVGAAEYEMLRLAGNTAGVYRRDPNLPRKLTTPEALTAF